MEMMKINQKVISVSDNYCLENSRRITVLILKRVNERRSHDALRQNSIVSMA